MSAVDELAEERRVLALILHLWRFTPSARLAARRAPAVIPEQRRTNRARRFRDVDVPLWLVRKGVRVPPPELHTPKQGGHL